MEGVFCFFSGVVIYLLYRKCPRIGGSDIAWTGIEFLALGAVVAMVSNSFKGKGLVMPVLFCGIVFLFAYEKGLISKILKLPSLLHLGKLSYSIYMVHTAIITALTALLILAGKVAGKKFALHIGWERYFSFDNVLLNNLFFCFVVTLVLFVSNLTYKYIEVPGIALGRKKLRIAKTEAAATE